MSWKIYNETIEVIEYNEQGLFVYLKDIGETVQIEFGQLEQGPQKIIEYNHVDQLFVVINLEGKGNLNLFTLNKTLWWTIDNTNVIQSKKNKLFHFNISKHSELINIQRVGLATIQIDVPSVNKKITLENFLTNDAINLWFDCKLDTVLNKGVLGKVEYHNQHLIILYHNDSNKIQLVKTKFEILVKNRDISLNLNSNSEVKVSLNASKQYKNINLSALIKNRPKKIFGKNAFEYFKDENLIALFIVNRTRYYVYLRRFGIYIAKGSPYRVTQFKTYLKTLSIGKNFYIYGRMVHHAYNSFSKYDYLYTVNDQYQIAKFKRPFRKIKLLKQFGYFKIPARNLDLEDRVHYPLFLGTKKNIIHKFPLGRNAPVSKVYSIKKVADKVQVIRTNIYNQATYSIVPYSEMYSYASRIKIKLSYIVSNLFYGNKKNNVNLFFEKQASKADESGFRVFEKVKENPSWNSKNYFILDRNSLAYPVMKEKYGKFIIDRFSFRHYLAIFNGDYFISSDLSNHVINDRIYINEITNKLKEVPLVFLQHGIMFAKPVENPLGKIFYKNYAAYNIYKNVVNSRLEAMEFYKMGYDDLDLLYTGLATFDYAKLDKTSDKIVYMPTYRYWEEGMIYSGDIEKTTYFRSLIKVIKAFENAGLRDKLMIVSHNKFAEYIYESMEDYRDILGPNPSEALKVGRIFISDFSSAIYDAIYRGAYPIFYWEDKDYLIEKYGAVPPVNEENAPGPIAINADELVKIARQAISQSYKLDEDNKNRYRNINNFSDNNNTQRIVDFLEEDGIL